MAFEDKTTNRDCAESQQFVVDETILSALCLTEAY